MKTLKVVKTVVLAISWLLAAAPSLLLGAGRLAGFEALVVQSGSMEPRIPVGSLAVADMHCDYGSIEKRRHHHLPGRGGQGDAPGVCCHGRGARDKRGCQ